MKKTRTVQGETKYTALRTMRSVRKSFQYMGNHDKKRIAEIMGKAAQKTVRQLNMKGADRITITLDFGALIEIQK